MHCTLPAQTFALGQAGHDLKGVAENHAVAPVLVVLVKLGLVHAERDAVKVGEEIGRELPGFVLRLARGAQEVVDEHFRMDFLLDVKRRGVDDEVAPILLIFPAPDELRVEVAIALVARGLRSSCSFCRTDWYSAVGMFFRFASSWISVSTDFFGFALAALAMLDRRFRWLSGSGWFDHLVRSSY